MIINVRYRAALVAGAISVCFGLAGCGGSSVSLPTGDGGSVKVDKDSNDFSIESDDGSIKSTTGKLPDGFPEAEVPVLPGTIVSSVGIDSEGQRGWSVVVEADPDADPDAAFGLLEKAGFVSESSMDAGGSKTRTYQTDEWDVLVSVTAVDGDRNVSYTVAPAER